LSLSLTATQSIAQSGTSASSTVDPHISRSSLLPFGGFRLNRPSHAQPDADQSNPWNAVGPSFGLQIQEPSRDVRAPALLIPADSEAAYP